MAKPVVRNPSIQTTWFKAEFDKRGFTSRHVADKIGMGYPDLSRCLKGEAHFELQEVVDLAKLLGVSLGEILLRVGIDNAHVAVPSASQVQVTGLVDRDGFVTPLEDGAKISSSVAMAVEALRVTSHPGLDNATLFLDKPREAASCVGRLCLVTVSGGKQGLFYVRRGSDDGLFTLMAAGDTTKVQLDVRVNTVKPVLWTKL